ncbi:MAG: hypothetical protein GY754_21450 [bacterium]|nr:hypothetical protein [bacterium]
MKKILLVFFIIAMGAFVVSYFTDYNFFLPGGGNRKKEKTIEILSEELQEAREDYKDGGSVERLAVAHKQLGEKLVDNKNWTPGIQNLEKAIEFGSSGARVHHLLGGAYANRAKSFPGRDDVEKAKFHYLRSVELNPKILDARYGLGIVYYVLEKDYNNAIKTMNEIIAQDPSYHRARFVLGSVYYEKRDKNKSLSTYLDLESKLKQEIAANEKKGKKESPVLEKYLEHCSNNINNLNLELSIKK